MDTTATMGNEVPKKRTKKTKAADTRRSERVDFRVTKAEKDKLTAVAKRMRRTTTSLLHEWLEGLK